MVTIRDILALCILASCATVTPFWGIEDKTDLMDTAEVGDVNRMLELIKAGADVNAVEGCDYPSTGYPVLRYAIDSGSIGAVEVLLMYGADPNKHTSSPIMHPERFEANVRNLPLLAHAIRSHAPLEMIQLLIQYHADVNQKTIFNEWTPLMVAAYYGNIDAVYILIAAGADCNTVNTSDCNHTAYDYAYESGYLQIAEILRNHMQPCA